MDTMNKKVYLTINVASASYSNRINFLNPGPCPNSVPVASPAAPEQQSELNEKQLDE